MPDNVAMISLQEIKNSFLHLFFPHICAGCSSDLLSEKSQICLHCLADMPATHFQKHINNPVEKIFYGRLPLVSGTAGYYFKKESLMQELVHQFKYRGNKELGLQLGRLLGKYLTQSERFNADALVPLPLFAAKERKRGYNQATVLCEGIAAVTGLPILNDAVIRTRQTETQTHKGRLERWENMEGKFRLTPGADINNRHLLLVDDVITTGATLEACGNELLKGEQVRLSIAALCLAEN